MAASGAGSDDSAAGSSVPQSSSSFEVAQSRDAFTFVVLGASGDLAKKKTYPALFELFCAKLLPRKVQVIGYARSKLSDSDLRDRLRPFLEKKAEQLKEEDKVDGFLELCSYSQGQYDSPSDMKSSMEEASAAEKELSETGRANRIFYLAVPPTVFVDAAKTAREGGFGSSGWNRVVVEKPFGHDAASSAELSRDMKSLLKEEEMYRIDHYLGKEMVQNLMVLRFANAVFEPLWNREHVSMVTITFKEPFGTEGREGYFDKFGIIRDILQNHLLQVLSIVAMEPPVSLAAEDVRDEKVKVLRCVPPVRPDDVVVGQYGASSDGERKAYRDGSPEVADSTAPTFCTSVIWVHNRRWAGVPFVLKAGKALNERKAEIRIQFRDPPQMLLGGARPSVAEEYGQGPGPVGAAQLQRQQSGADSSDGGTVVSGPKQPLYGYRNAANELVIRIQPNEAVYLKILSKLPGLQTAAVPSELDLNFSSRFPLKRAPEAYARLLLDVLRGDQSQFVRTDELAAAWEVFTPLLHRLEGTDGGPPVQPIIYRYGSRGPTESDDLIRRMGFKRDESYDESWRQATDPDELRQMRDSLQLSTGTLLTLVNQMLSEMEAGLAKEDSGSTMKMIFTHIQKVPTGREEGRYWGVDVGGSNLRVQPVRLSPDGKGKLDLSVEECKVGEAIPEEVRMGDADGLMSYLASKMKDGGVQDGDVVGFTFSFPVRQTAIDEGELIAWTKEWGVSGVVDKPLVAMLRAALVKVGLGGVKIACMLSDTVATLLAARAANPACVCGVILGTGTNAAYVGPCAGIKKLSGEQRAGGLAVINTEWGAFNSQKNSSVRMPLTPYDNEMDEQMSWASPGTQRFEKMISGAFLGPICRVALQHLVKAGILFAHGEGEGKGGEGEKPKGPYRLPEDSPLQPGWQPSGPSDVRFETRIAFDAVRDRSGDLMHVEKALREQLQAPGSTLKERKMVREVCDLVVRRAARLTAVGIAAVLQQAGTIGGSGVDTSRCLTKGAACSGVDTASSGAGSSEDKGAENEKEGDDESVSRGRSGTSGSVSGSSEGSSLPVVAIDGSVFLKNRDLEAAPGEKSERIGKGFDRWVGEALGDLGVRCRLVEATEGSSLGAAVCAAMYGSEAVDAKEGAAAAGGGR